MNDFEKLKKLADEISKDFFSISKIPYADKKLHEFYSEKYPLWIENAIELRHNFPVETNHFLAKIYRSNFSFKVATDRFSLLKKKPRYSIYDKIRIIKNAFENSYHHFGLLTICSNYSKDYVNTLFNRWYIPDSAKEYCNDNKKRPWKDDSNRSISGKKWTILNCPLLQLSPYNIDIIQTIKNSESHEKLVIREKEVIILDDKKSPKHIRISEIDKLFRFLFNSINLALHFNIVLGIKYNFWIIPTLIITNHKKFDFKKIDLPSIKDESKAEIKAKSKRTISIDTFEYLMALGISFFNFIFFKMWNKILEDKDEINNFLRFYKFKFDNTKLADFQKLAIIDLISILQTFNRNVKAWDLDEKSDQFEDDEITIDNLKGFDFEKLLIDLKNTFTKIYSLDSRKVKKNLIVYFYISMGVSLIMPLSRINESLKEIIVDI